jgi:hypothetical protein
VCSIDSTPATCTCIVTNLQTRPKFISSCWISTTCLKHIPDTRATTRRILKDTTCNTKILQSDREVQNATMSIVSRVRVGVGDSCLRYPFTEDQRRRRLCVEFAWNKCNENTYLGIDNQLPSPPITFGRFFSFFPDRRQSSHPILINYPQHLKLWQTSCPPG